MTLEEKLKAFQNHEISLDDMMNSVRGTKSILDTTLDIQREERTGLAETVYGAGKTKEQIFDIIQELKKHQQTVLVTRVEDQTSLWLQSQLPELRRCSQGQTLLFGQPGEWKSLNEIGIIVAGTSDKTVAEECLLSLEAFGHKAKLYMDVGVAGLHRLLNRLSELRKHKQLIVIAGMEGALCSVVAGLVKSPVIAVPTSVGYGSHLNGITPLLGMLNSCSPGISVVNIDNGYGAAVVAAKTTDVFSAK
ncbi:MAG: 1-(5-phosphoribosyl)-5-amino-4-imidazole-carboxylate carboxylase [Proteobacteria bacterium]|nr:1-(5-phosphoribosyl)-5-amino-4-imidazole-carboxylate carboxylase [Pseudomonadota bacterium]